MRERCRVLGWISFVELITGRSDREHVLGEGALDCRVPREAWLLGSKAHVDHARAGRDRLVNPSGDVGAAEAGQPVGEDRRAGEDADNWAATNDGADR